MMVGLLLLMEMESRGNGFQLKEVLSPVYTILRIGRICAKKQFLKEISGSINNEIILNF